MSNPPITSEQLVDMIRKGRAKEGLFRWREEQEGRIDLRKAGLIRANLRGTDLREANLSKTDLTKADLREADLCQANLREADLFHADLRKANLRQANLAYVNLSEADLREADLTSTTLFKADFTGADLTGAKLPSWEQMVEAEIWKACGIPADVMTVIIELAKAMGKLGETSDR